MDKHEKRGYMIITFLSALLLLCFFLFMQDHADWKDYNQNSKTTYVSNLKVVKGGRWHTGKSSSYNLLIEADYNGQKIVMNRRFDRSEMIDIEHKVAISNANKFFGPEQDKFADAFQKYLALDNTSCYMVEIGRHSKEFLEKHRCVRKDIHIKSYSTDFIKPVPALNCNIKQ
jgi:hypothetical protein